MAISRHEISLLNDIHSRPELLQLPLFVENKWQQVVRVIRRAGASINQEAIKKLGARFLEIYDPVIGSINALAIVQTVIFAGGAFPANYENIYRLMNKIGLAISFSQFAINMAALKKVEIKWRDYTIKMEDLNHCLSAIITGSNTATFDLGSLIALYVVWVNMGDKQVDVKDMTYALGFLLPSAITGVSHTALQLTKKKWSSSSNLFAKSANVSNKILETLYNSSNINSFMMLVLSAWGISEAGNINPYDRLGMFLIAFGLGLLSVILNSQLPASSSSIDRFINTTCAIVYLSYTLMPSSRSELGMGFTAAFVSTYALISLLSIGFNILSPRPANVESLVLNIPSFPKRREENNESTPLIAFSLLRPALHSPINAELNINYSP